MKCQILIPGKNKKNIHKCSLLKILPRVLSVKYINTYLYINSLPLSKTVANEIRIFQRKIRASELSAMHTIHMKC